MKTETKKVMKIAIPIIAVLFAAFVAFNSLTIVEAGHTGVVTTFGKVNEGVLQEGIHFKIYIQEPDLQQGKEILSDCA